MYRISWLLLFLLFGCTTAEKEFGPEAAVRKYGWFKDTAAALDAKLADISVYEARQKATEEEYRGKEKPRDVREQLAIQRAELAGVKASYNHLAAEYNAAMAKINWRFADVGGVPQGGKTLRREYSTYLEN